MDGNLEVVGRGRDPQWQDGGGEGSGWAGSDTRGGCWDYHLLRVRLGFLGRVPPAPLKAVSQWFFPAGQMVSELSLGGWAS